MNLAVSNLDGSIYFYSLHRRSYSASCPCRPEGKLTSKPVGLEFLDEWTVIAGHCNGHLVIATQGVRRDPDHLEFAEAMSCESLLTTKGCLSKPIVLRSNTDSGTVSGFSST